MSTPKVTTIRLPETDLRKAKKIARQLDRSVSWVLREAIADYIKRQNGGVA